MFFHNPLVVLVLAVLPPYNPPVKCIEVFTEDTDFVDLGEWVVRTTPMEIIDVTIGEADWQLPNNTIRSDVWKNFIEHRVVPVIIPIPPSLECTVTFDKKYHANYGNVIPYKHIKRPPKITYNAKPDKYYLLYMTGIRYFPNYTYYIRRMKTTWRKPLKYEWHQWIVGNIPADNIKRGIELVKYQDIVLPIEIYKQEYVILIYEQPRKQKFIKKPKQGKFTEDYYNVYQFARYHGLGHPKFGNFFKQSDPDPTTPGPNATTPLGKWWLQ